MDSTRPAAAGSRSDPDGTVVSYSWVVSDGGSSTRQNPSHTFAAAGNYIVTLTVTDSNGQTTAVSQLVTIAAPPPPPPPPPQTVCTVPNVKGKSLAAARRALGAHHCSVGRVTSPHKPKHAPGKHKKWALGVSRETPAVGSTGPPGNQGRAQPRVEGHQGVARTRATRTGASDCASVPRFRWAT